MKVSKNGINLIAKFEGFVPTVYKDAVGVKTIGFGFTDSIILAKGKLTRAEGLEILERVANAFGKQVYDLLDYEVTQNQFDALVSLSYNVGIGNFKKSTLLKLINTGDFASAAKEFDKWIFAGGKRLAGLVKRRAAERALFESDELYNSEVVLESEYKKETPDLVVRFFTWIFSLIKKMLTQKK